MRTAENSTYAVIPTRDATEYKQKGNVWEPFGVNRVVVEGAESIFDVMETFLYSNKLDDEDIVILAHDDIDILSDQETFDYCLDVLNYKEVGFIGVAGTQHFKPSAIWWEGLGGQYPVTPLAGAVYHGPDKHSMQPSFYGPNNARTVVVMDGLFLAAKVRTWKKIRTAKPSTFKGLWDFYDIYYTFQAYGKGMKNLVMPLALLHHSPGSLEGRKGWHDNRDAFIEKYKKHLPASVWEPDAFSYNR